MEYTKELLENAKHNNVQAIIELAECYFEGKGISKNYKKAFKWFNKALEINADNSYAIYRVGKCYMDGSGISKNVQKGLSFFKKAADFNDIIAICTLSHIYASDSIVEHNYEMAIQQVEKGMKLNYSEAFARMAEMYVWGECGLDINSAKALSYWEKAKELENDNSLIDRCITIHSRSLFDYYDRLDKNNDRDVMFDIANIYMCGNGDKQNLTKGLELMKEIACNENHPKCIDAQRYLGYNYEYGILTEKNEKLALEWYERAVYSGDESAQADIDLIYWRQNKEKMEQQKTSALEICSLVFGILGLLCCASGIFGFIGLIISIVALATKHKSGLSIAGLVCSIISVLLFIIYICMVWEMGH